MSEEGILFEKVLAAEPPESRPSCPWRWAPLDKAFNELTPEEADGVREELMGHIRRISDAAGVGADTRFRFLRTYGEALFALSKWRRRA